MTMFSGSSMFSISSLAAALTIAVVAGTAPAAVAAAAGTFQCSPPHELHPKYLRNLVSNSDIPNKFHFVNNFVPSAYYHGETVKFISTYQTKIENIQLCVDGSRVAPSRIQLYDDGTHGDDVANDGVYTRDCVHFCDSYVNYDDYYGYALERRIDSARLVVVDPALRGQIPVEILPNPLFPDATLMATSHAAFFVDEKHVYFPDWPKKAGLWWDAPLGQNHAFSAVLKAFGDVFDFLTISSYETQKALPGASTYRWQNWAAQGRDEDARRIGAIDRCMMSMTGVPIMRMMSGLTNIDTVEWMDAQQHEIEHIVAGFRYHNDFDGARNASTGHVPGSCTTDHSHLQGPIWDWTKGHPTKVPMGYCADDPDCRPLRDDVVRLEPNADCASCPLWKLSECCTFRYVDSLATAKHMRENPELRTMSPLLLYIAGLLPFEDVPKDKQVYYCIGPNVDSGGCGSDSEDPDRKQCDHKVDESNRNKITSDYVERFTFDELVQANGGRRWPPKRAVRDLRHGAVYIGQRMPVDAEIVFYTMLWRHQEVQRYPWGRVPRPGRDREDVLITWLYTTNGLSTLHSRFHGIECGGGLQVPSCFSDETVCDDKPCHPLASCIPLDSRPLCLCPPPLVGDGTVCVWPEETQSYDKILTAHEMYFDPDPYYKEDCFGSDWPKTIKEADLPPYPGGIAPYSATSCNETVCSVCFGGICEPTEVQELPEIPPTPVPPPATAQPPPQIQSLVPKCLSMIFDDSRCTCGKKQCMEIAINKKCMNIVEGTQQYVENAYTRFELEVARTCKKPVKPLGASVQSLVKGCIRSTKLASKCPCGKTHQQCIQSAVEQCAGAIVVDWKRTAFLANIQNAMAWKCTLDKLSKDCADSVLKACRSCGKKVCIQNSVKRKCPRMVSGKAKKKQILKRVRAVVTTRCSSKKKSNNRKKKKKNRKKRSAA